MGGDDSKPDDRAAFSVKPQAGEKNSDKEKVDGSKRKLMGYENQVVRAGIWTVVYFFVWLVQRLWCHLNLPEYCTVAEKPLDVLTDLLVLFTFSLTQAWWCELLDDGRFESIKKAPWVFVVIFITPLIISGLGQIDGLKPWDQTNPGEDFEFSSVRTTIYIFGLVAVVLFIAWHFARAWLTLPGVMLISGTQGTGDAKPPEKNELGIYMASRVVIVAYAILFTSFLLSEDDGMNYRGALLAWVLSLIATFPHSVSNLWLALNTGIFLQGIGSHRLAFLGCENQ